MTVEITSERRVNRTDPPQFMFKPVGSRIIEGIVQPAGLRAKVTSIVAPVGYGKTVLMSSLFTQLQARGEQCFWTMLDARDISLERVLSLFEAVAMGPIAELHPTQALLRGEAPEVRIERLLDAAVRYPKPYIAFIDNLNCCTDEALGSLLDRLVFETPSTAQFVFSSTAELPMNLTRAKLEGLVQQIGYRELSLDAAEVADLLGPELAAAVGTEGVVTVTGQTEGWPAAVRMAQIVLSSSANPRDALLKFSGSDEDIAALLNRQVLSGFSPALREFVLTIAQFESFCGELCVHVTGNPLAEQYLAELLRRNVFIIPLDRNRVWYRMHGLFREFLLREAAHALDVARRQQIVHRAAEWCEQGGYWRDAIDYALAGGSLDLAARVLERTATLFVRDRGDVQQYTLWVEVLHDRGLVLGWEAEYWYVWALILHRRYEYGSQRNELLDARARAAMPDGDRARLEDLLRRLEIIRTCIGIFTDDLPGAAASAAHWLAARSPGDDPFNAMAASCIEAIGHAGAFMFAEAREAMQQAQADSFQVNSPYTSGWITALNALIPLYEGDYAGVRLELASPLAAARAVLGDTAGICGTIALLAAKCAVETGADREAGEMLALGVRSTKLHGILDAIACGLDAAVKLWSDRPDDPVSLSVMREIAACYPPRLSLILSCYLVQRLIVLGRVEEAVAEAAKIGLSADPTESRGKPSRHLQIARCRDSFVAAEIDLCIATGHYRQAEQLLAEESRSARVDGRSARQVELALAEAAIAAQNGEASLANRHLTRAISIAAMRDIVRPFRDRARLIADLVEDTRPASWGFALAKERRFFADICRMLPISNRALQDRLVELNIESHLLDALTARQIELLGLLEAGLSNQQIADRIGVTLSTVKGHLQRLFGKLGVKSRSAALARARALNLLS